MKFIPIKPASSPHRIVEKPLQNRRELVVKACNTCRMRKSKVNKPLQSSKRIVARTELRLVFWRPTDVDDKEEKGKKFEILSAFAKKLKDLPLQDAERLLHAWRSSDGKIEPLSKLLDVPTEPESVPASVSGPQVLTSREQTAFFVDAFFSTNDQVFHVFSRDQVEKYIHLCYDEDSQKQTADACCLSAVAAVGSQYRHEVVDKQLRPRRTFYDLARGHFESARDIQPSDAIKVSTMLCLYNITSSADEAARYAGMQNEMLKVSLLNARARQTLRASKELTEHSLQKNQDDLNTWYDELPSEAKIGAMFKHDTSTRLSIWRTHLLHLGGMMLCYRQIAAKGSPEQESSLLEFKRNAVDAAITSARAFRLLLDSEEVPKH
ncbi:ankyrin repeat protein [Apiospora marii]|uniref:ankyrin repeat protein n=1 Tax=Apiospora marii TaxID=335849 RepID=UPI0031300C32